MADVDSFLDDVAKVRAPRSPLYVRGTELERFVAKVSFGQNDECDLWLGTPDKHGYGQFHSKGRGIGAHRWALASFLGRKLSPKENANHACDTPLCVKVGPEHVYLGTQAMNMYDMFARDRAYTQADIMRARTHCLKGHEYTSANTRITPQGRRSCRQCARELMQQRRQGRK